ncbi:MAG: hypothetical protein ACYDCQ_08880 [Dehalococcoidia bacterium]
MLRYSTDRYQRSGGQAPTAWPRNRFDGYQFSLFAPPTARVPARGAVIEPYAVRSVTPALRSLVARHNGRCPECAGPLVSGEACVACPVCGFRRQGW